MKTKIGIFLLVSAFVLSCVGASFATESQTPATKDYSFNQDIAALAAVVTPVTTESFTLVNYYTIANQTALRGVNTFKGSVAEVLDPGRSFENYISDYKKVPTPKVKTLKAQRLVRLIFKHPKGSV